MNPAGPAARAPRGSAETLVHFAFILNGMVTTLLGPILPVLALRWQLTDAQAGYFFTAQFTGNLLGVGLTSVLLQRRRPGVCLGAGYLLAALGVAGVALHDRQAVLAAVLLYGVGLGLAIPTSNLFVSAINPERRAAALSVLNFMWGIGAVICPMLVSLAERRATLAVFLIALAVALAAIALLMSSIGTAPVARRDVPRLAFSRLFASRFGVALGLMFFLYVGTETALGGWTADLAERVSGRIGTLWVLAPSFFWSALLAGRALAPAMLRFVRERSLALLGLALAAAGTVLLLMARSVGVVLAASAVAGLGLAAIFPLTVALLAGYGADEKRAAGPMFALAAVGGAVLPWVVGFTSTRTASLKTGLLVPLAATLVLFVLHGARLLPRSRRISAAE